MYIINNTLHTLEIKNFSQIMLPIYVYNLYNFTTLFLI